MWYHVANASVCQTQNSTYVVFVSCFVQQQAVITTCFVHLVRTVAVIHNSSLPITKALKYKAIMSKKQSRLHSSVNKFDVSLGTNIVLRHQMSDGDELV